MQIDMADKREQPNTLLKTIETNKEDRFEKCQELIQMQAEDELLQDGKLHIPPNLPKIETLLNWTKVWDQKRLEESKHSLGPEEAEALESQKVDLVQQIHTVIEDYAEAKKEEQTIAEKFLKMANEKKSTEAFINRVRAQLDQNFAALRHIQKALQDLQKIERPQLEGEIQTLFKAQKILVKNQDAEYESSSGEMRDIFHQEALNVQEVLVRKTRILELEKEIEFLLKRTDHFLSKKQKSEEETFALHECDNRKISDLESVVEFVRGIARGQCSEEELPKN